MNVAARIDEVTLVASLQFTALLAKERITLSKTSNQIIKPALMLQILTTHPVFGTKDVSRATFNPCVSWGDDTTILIILNSKGVKGECAQTWSSTDTSVVSMLSVFHFWFKPSSYTWSPDSHQRFPCPTRWIQMCWTPAVRLEETWACIATSSFLSNLSVRLQKHC